MADAEAAAALVERVCDANGLPPPADDYAHKYIHRHDATAAEAMLAAFRAFRAGELSAVWHKRRVRLVPSGVLP